MILEFENHSPKYVNSGTSWKVEVIHLANFIYYEKNSRDVYKVLYYDKDNTWSRYGVFRGGEMWGVQGRTETKFPISTSRSCKHDLINKPEQYPIKDHRQSY